MKQTKTTLPFPYPPKTTRRSHLARVRSVDPSFKLGRYLVAYWPGHGQYLSSALRAWDASRYSKTGDVTGATNAAPIVITSAAHGLLNGQSVAVAGVGGNTAANGVFTVANRAANTFELSGSTGNGAYTSGGIWTLLIGSRINADGEAGVSFVSTARGRAMRTPGGGSLSAWNAPSNLRFDSIPLTICMWVRLREIDLTGSPLYNIGVLGRHDSSSNRNGITIYVRCQSGGSPVTPTWACVATDGSSNEAITYDNVQALVGTWYHIAMVFDRNSATGMNGYIDGRLFKGSQGSPKSTTGIDPSFAFNSQGVRWGQMSNFSQFQDAKADYQHIMWFNKALTGQEIALLRERTWDVGNLGAGYMPLLFSDPDMPRSLTQNVAFGSLFNYEGEFERSISQNLNFASSFTADSAVENGVVFGSTFNADQPEGSFSTDVRFGSRFTVETSDLAVLRYRR